MVNVDAGFRLAGAYADMVRYAFAPDVLPTVIPRLVTLCLAIAFLVLAVAAVRLKPDTADGVTANPAARTSRSRPMVGAHCRRAVEHRAGASSFSRIAVASLPRARHRERAAAGRSEPPLHGAVVRKPRPARISRAHHRDARRGDARRPRLRRDRRGAPAGIFPARPRRSDRSERRRAQPGVRRACGGDVRAGADRAAPDCLFARELLERGVPSHLRSHRRGGAIARRAGGGGRRAGDYRVPRLGSLGPASSDASQPGRCDRACPSISRLPRPLPFATPSRCTRSGSRGCFVIQPLHNPIGPLDFEGTYDERSDRNQSLGELIDRGYEDAYRQFVEPVVGGRTRLEI